MTNADLASALRTVAAFLDKDPRTAVDEQIRSSVSDLIGEISRRQARSLLDADLSSITSWLSRLPFWTKGGSPPKT